MDIPGAFDFQQAIPIIIQKKFKADWLHKGKEKGKLVTGQTSVKGTTPAVSSQSIEPQVNRPIVITKV